jgi:hypothetical protein
LLSATRGATTLLAVGLATSASEATHLQTIELRSIVPAVVFGHLVSEGIKFVGMEIGFADIRVAHAFPIE